MIIKFSELKNLQSEKTVYASGVFDLTHPGHFELFRTAKQLYPDHKLVVGIMGDKRVRLKKGKNRPILNEKEKSKRLMEASGLIIVLSTKEQI